MTRDQRRGGKQRGGKQDRATFTDVEPPSPSPPEALEARPAPPPDSIEFEWDEEKAEINRKKHGVTFEDARTIFGDLRTLTVPDRMHSDEEERSITLGMSTAGHVLVVVHTERGRKIRLISARLASPGERRTYEAG